MKQEYKITGASGESVYFFAHSLKTAHEHAQDYMKRNAHKSGLTLYRVNDQAIPAARWIKEKSA